MGQLKQNPLSTLLRLYIYGLHGFLIEIVFTAAWEFVVNLNWKLPGCSSVWSFLIYGTSGLVMEKIFYVSVGYNLPLTLRGIFYLIWVYIWEFSTGLILKQFGACSWDYAEFTYNIKGLITLEYAPLWFTVSILTEIYVIKNLSSLHWTSNSIQNGEIHNAKKS